MICPRCHYENNSRAGFCHRCGAPLKKASAIGRLLRALFACLSFYALFYTVQIVVSLLYTEALSTALTYRATANALAAGTAVDTSALAAAVQAQLQENVHVILILSAALTLLLLCIWFRYKKRNPFQEIHLRPIRKNWILPALLFGAALQVVATFTIALIPIPEDVMTSYSESMQIILGGSMLLRFISAAIVTPIMEETVFRGLIFSRLKHALPPWIAVILSAAIFGAAHGHILSFMYASTLGILLAVLMHRCGDSILVPIFVHAGFNGASFLMDTIATLPPILLLALYCISIALAVACAYLLLRKTESAAAAPTV